MLGNSSKVRLHVGRHGRVWPSDRCTYRRKGTGGAEIESIPTIYNAFISCFNTIYDGSLRSGLSALKTVWGIVLLTTPPSPVTVVRCLC